ncbi:ester cyclase [Sphingobium sp.]|uniref:ester cyclase n=1 Tax=Sphingobium sp. TaxID=1912891 RepID=UPI0028BE2B60|nr:ester cyclase [Sphingobium sp.]
MSENTEIVRTWMDILNRKAADEVDRVFCPDGYVTYGSHGMPDAHGPEAISSLVKKFFEAFPDLDSSIEELFDAHDGRVVGRFLTRATHTGKFVGIEPTGKRVAFDGVAIYRFKDGKIAHEWNMDDLLGLMQQIGAVPGTA